jgi:hypothetical protein
MPRYSITIAFNADRTLSEEELNELANACLVQVEEPVDGDGNDLDFTVTDTEVFTMKIKE